MKLSDLKKRELALISACFLFRDVPPDRVRAAIESPWCELIDFHKGGVVFDVRDFSRSIGLVLSGEIEVAKRSDGHRYVMNTLVAGSVFGAAAVFSEEEDYVTSLTARSACRVVFIPQPLLEELIRSDYGIAENYIRFLSGRIRFLNRKIGTLLLSGTGRTVAHDLIANAVEQDGAYVVRPAGSLSDMAGRLNIGRASLYRSFDAMEAAGLIRKNGREIRILDLEGLASFK